ncbi:diaminopropionate ammonia-lyase [uncultured Phascolarctobacterium sp.]|uniref:diaminopropionate ammonia-lyase n=1 Tax=uncultured Phascolarctobacterium sp. TaxID=512296 RepID=UPI003453BF4C
MVKLKHEKPYGEVSTAIFGVEQAAKVLHFHQSFPEYSVTPLVKLENLAKELGIKEIYVKDESYRFGLNAFKVLGGSYAIAREIGKRLHLAEYELNYATLVSPEVRKKLGELTFVTATDGNHGRGVAWTARRLGQRAVVFMPKGTAAERLENIRKLGADASITDVNYDDAVRMAQQYAKVHGSVVVQDTSWEDYNEIPQYIMQGYTTMGREILQQLKEYGDVKPTHVFLQAGVGAMAGAMAGFIADYYKEARPQIIIVEPNSADCLYRTALANNGKLQKVGGDLHSIMAGLCCGEPCSLGWQQLAAYADYFVSMPDKAAALGMRVLGNPLPGDAAIISGESGAAGVGLLAAVLREKQLQELAANLKLNLNSVALCISTEGATDIENYRRIMWEGAWSWND